MKFIDEVTIEIKAGDGGAGCVSFRRARYIPKGGPDGGDGGNGGSIIFVTDKSVNTLIDFYYKRHIKASNGRPGMGSQCNGPAGEDIYVKVPVGTCVYDAETGEQLADLVDIDTEYRIAEGGRGGLGNMNFATSVRQAPRFAQPGTEGEHRRIRMELKLMADVGLLGFPNVGKSTFISRVSAAKPKIADYPFTTLTPKLGVVRLSDERAFVIADIPGLIPGASTGAGLGFQFLRHVSRVKVLLHLVAFDYAQERDLVKDYLAIRQELAQFHEDLLTRPEIIVVNKIDLKPDEERLQVLKELANQQNRPLHFISAVSGEGMAELLEAIWRILKDFPNQ